MQTNLVDLIIEKIKRKEEISPFLFLWWDFWKLNNKIEQLTNNFITTLWINKNFIFLLKDNNEKIKVKDIKEFLEKVYVTPTYWAQVLIIENISRMTEESANSCLKIFEEPPIWNILILTNNSESWILETILSRCTLINLEDETLYEENNFYQNMIDDYVRWINHDLASYIYKEKLEKTDYINILQNFIIYFKKNLVFLNLIDKINEDINWIIKNNVLPKYIVDKYILKIKQ